MTMNRIDRYFYIPAEKVKDVTEKPIADRKSFVKKVTEFLNKNQGVIVSENRNGGIFEIAYPEDKPLPVKGWRINCCGYYNKQRVNRCIPDKRIKEGKAIAKEIAEINSHAVSIYAHINAVAEKYRLRFEMCIQNDRLYSYYGGYYEHCNAYLLAVPVCLDQDGLKNDYIVPPEITEITESQFIAITKEGQTLNAQNIGKKECSVQDGRCTFDE